MRTARRTAVRVHPPTESASDYLELLGAVEQSAARTRPTRSHRRLRAADDPRINVIKVTPGSRRDRGQHPSRAQLARSASRSRNTIYEEAHQAAFDDREVSTRRQTHRHRRRQSHRRRRRNAGRQARFWRRPDLLKSIVAFWQNHAVAFLHVLGTLHRTDESSPRVDEARLDSLYELEIGVFRSAAALEREGLAAGSSTGSFATC